MTNTVNEFGIDDAAIASVLAQDVEERVLPKSIYDIAIPSADGTIDNVFASSHGKVTLLFNVAAGCGNIPQHRNIELLRQQYEENEDFQIIAVTVDDFVCHGYPEFQDGIDKYIERNNLDLTPGQVAQKYAQDNYAVKYNFTALTNGRYDKHTYDTSFVPGAVKTQEQHELWHYLTESYCADLQDNGLPLHDEDIPWSGYVPHKDGESAYSSPLTGNFTKFLVDRTGTRFRRFGNGFLLGERDIHNNAFPWIRERHTEAGVRDHRPVTTKEGSDEPVDGPYPTPRQSFGISLSLEIISRYIDAYLAEGSNSAESAK